MVNVAVYYIVRAMRAERTAEISGVPPGICGMQAWDNLSAQGADFVVIRAGLRSVDQKIHLKSLAIGMAQNVHKPCLNPAAAHPSHDVQDANSPRCVFHFAPLFFSACAITTALSAP